jgi:hypothetical protein
LLPSWPREAAIISRELYGLVQSRLDANTRSAFLAPDIVVAILEGRQPPGT